MAFWQNFFRRSNTSSSTTPEMERILEGLTGEPGPGEARHRIALCERGFQLLEKSDDPKLWAMLQREMALRFLNLTDGNRAENVERAIEALKAALEVRTRESMPAEWARTRSNLASTYSDRIYGDRAENIECTIAGLKEVLEVRTRTTALMDWAGTQMDLAIAFVNRLKGDRSENIERAIRGYEAALEVFNPTEYLSEWAAAQMNLANAFCRRLRGERAENIERAIAGYMLVLQAQENSGLPPERIPGFVDTRLNVAHAFLERVRGRRSENVETAITYCEAALRFLSPELSPLEWADAQISLANALLERTQDDRSTNVERAIESYTPALDVLTAAGTPELWVGAKINLANAYLDRLGANRSENVEHAISSCREVLDVVTPSAMPKEWGKAQVTLGSALIHRTLGDRAENVEQAISCYEAALALRSEHQEPLSYAGLHMNLANAYMERLRGVGNENCHQAIAYYQEALKVFSLNNTPLDWALTQMNLATAYSGLIGLDREANRERSIAACKAALQVYTQNDTPHQWAAALTNLANTLVDTEEAENVEQAIAAHWAVLEVWTETAAPVQWALTQENLASAYQQRVHGDPAENLMLAATACRAALEVLRAEASPAAHVKVQGRLGNILFDQHQWEEAATSLRLAIHTRDLLYRSAATEEVRHDILKKFGVIEHRLAFALVHSGGQPNLQQAAVALERGWGRLVAEHLIEERLSFDAVELSDRQAFEQARREIEDLRSKARETMLNRSEYLKLSAELRNAHQKLDEAVKRIRSYVPNFFAEAGWEDVCEAARVTPLLYLVATHAGGYGILINREGTAQSIPLPDLLRQPLIDKALEYLPKLYENDRLEGLDEMLRWLWDCGMGRIVTELRGEKEVLVIAGGMLRPLPLHGAWCFDEQDPTGRRYAMDSLTFRYAPNASSFLAAHKTASRITLSKVLAVENPRPSMRKSLPAAEWEIGCVLRHFGDRVTLLREEKATLELVLKLLPEFSLLHFACHGRVSPFRPLDNGLCMAHDEILSLRDLLNTRLTNVRLAVLSACDTAISGVEMQDEVFGLPAGLMIAGVDGVVGSLWQVSDASAMLLMVRFYDYWVGDGLEPSEALAQAQRWMRRTTRVEKDEYFRTTLALFDVEDMEKIRITLDADSQHPYFWASFCYTGV